MKSKYKAALAAVMGLSVAGCASIDYSAIQPGRFEGSVIVLWVPREHNADADRFLFVPDPQKPLTFTRRGSTVAHKIQPGLMYTDGGSIPKIAQLFNGFSPWGYAPAYMIHDWLFTARHCFVDRQPDPRFNGLENVDFHESAVILGEAIRALVDGGQVDRNDLAGATITNAVNSGIARSLWDVQGACQRDKVSAAHIAAAEEAIPGSSQFSSSPMMRARRKSLELESTFRRTQTPGAPGARIVNRVTFGR